MPMAPIPISMLTAIISVHDKKVKQDMKKIYYVTAIMTAALFTACQNDDPEVLETANSDNVISVGLEIDGHNDFSAYMGGNTRAPFEETEPSASSSLRAYIWASTTANKFQHTDVGGNGTNGSGYVVSKHAYTTFYNTYSALDRIGGKRSMVFPVNGKSAPDVYFIGLSPATDNGDPGSDIWTTNAGSTQAIFTFTGSEDVMYAPQVSGHYSGDVPMLHFYHLLTHLRFVLKCEGDTQDAREEVAYAWGKIKNITLTKQNNGADDPRDRVTIDLSKSATNLSQVETRSTFSNSGVSYLALFKKGANSYFPQNPAFDDEGNRVELPTTEDGEELAYILAAPVTATAGTSVARTEEYTLTLNTANRSNVTIPIDLMLGNATWYSGSTIGCEFIVTLNFRFGKVIATATAVKDWDSNGGQTDTQIKDE